MTHSSEPMPRGRFFLLSRSHGRPWMPPLGDSTSDRGSPSIMAAPSALVPTYLGYVDMLPAQYYTEVGSDAFNEAPVGTGMFKHVDSRIDEYILLEANEDYWGGAPHLQEGEIRFI